MKMTIDEFVSHDSGEVLRLKAKVERYEVIFKQITNSPKYPGYPESETWLTRVQRMAREALEVRNE